VTITVAPTVDTANSPPRVRLDVTSSASETSARVMRLDPDGVQRPVRTGDGNPLQLSVTGATGTGLVYDYEVPYGAKVTYSTLESPGTVSAQVTVPEVRPWLIHPGVPARSMPVTFAADSFKEVTYGVSRGVFQPMGRRFPVVQTDGQRKAATGSFIVQTATLTELAALQALVDDAGTLFLNVPTAAALGVPTGYVAIGDVKQVRLTDVGSNPIRNVVCDFMVVDQPVGGSQAQRTYADLLANYTTYAALQAAYPSYAAVLAGP